ncbi:hypothetical protein K435DRAFT_841555 [Dendrothele bispora CBS 962.96]|uniref:CCHC-type domain-containing protein n=1 Tax=Dendrothele bispora (strain CBS 962.96) TaxID=1314807 RepID=A0A4S8LMP5_DENBC|nr:hypothetical protein K435DRAFT_841555 [Dendrothele bispora CBS 962.96]
MSDRQTRSSGPVEDIPLPSTTRRSNTPAGSQTHTPPASSTSQIPPPEFPLDNPFGTLSPIMSEQNAPAGPAPGRSPSPTPPSTPSSVAPSIGAQNPNYVMPLSDISKDDWKMWKFRVDSAVRVIRNHHFKSSGLPPGGTVRSACLHEITGKIDNKILVHYLNETDALELLDKLAKRFDPTTTVHESNDLWKLFTLRKPVWEFDKLLDEATDMWATIKARDDDVPDKIFYSALVGIIPPQYHHVRTAYEATVKANLDDGKSPVYVPEALIDELRNEFNSYRAIHSRTNPSTTSSQKKFTKQSDGKGTVRTEKSKDARANAAAPYNKKSSDSKDRKCFNCNKMGHTTVTCPEPWTEKSKEAMKAKGITKQNKGKAKETAAAAIAGPSTSSLSRATSSTAQSDWVASISSADVEMKDTDDTRSLTKIVHI